MVNHVNPLLDALQLYCAIPHSSGLGTRIHFKISHLGWLIHVSEQVPVPDVSRSPRFEAQWRLTHAAIRWQDEPHHIPEAKRTREGHVRRIPGRRLSSPCLRLEVRYPSFISAQLGRLRTSSTGTGEWRLLLRPAHVVVHLTTPSNRRPPKEDVEYLRRLIASHASSPKAD